MTNPLITQKQWNAKLRELRVAKERIAQLERDAAPVLAPDMVSVPREQLQSIYAALNSDPPNGPQKTIDGDDTIYHLDGQKMYAAINAVRAMLAASGDRHEG